MMPSVSSFVVQRATNDKIPPVWPFGNIRRFSVLRKDQKLPCLAGRESACVEVHPLDATFGSGTQELFFGKLGASAKCL
jgi:hypothetical protein